MKMLQRNAYAKINLGLDVLGRREDNYHEVRMIMQTLQLHDTITLKQIPEDQIRLHTDLASLPEDKNNLAYQAAALMKETYRIPSGIEIHLTKRIPVAAGMAGGSSDCAAVLMGINELFHLSLGKQELMQLGVRLGADVPYCILGGAALSEGIGEILTPLPPLPPCYVVIAKPPIPVSTGHVYQTLDRQTLVSHPDIDGILHAVKHQDLAEMGNLLENILETVTISEYPVIEDLKTLMKEHGALGALMSGSGPTVFGLFDTREKACTAKLACETQYQEYETALTELQNEVPLTSEATGTCAGSLISQPSFSGHSY